MERPEQVNKGNKMEQASQSLPPGVFEEKIEKFKKFLEARGLQSAATPSSPVPTRAPAPEPKTEGSVRQEPKVLRPAVKPFSEVEQKELVPDGEGGWKYAED